MTKKVITYGTFDLLHYGHIELLRRAYELSGGAGVIVGLSTDNFNEEKGKTAYQQYNKRSELLSAIKYVTKVIPEDSWSQKESDIKRYDIDLFAIGDDWRGKFDYLAGICEVVYLSRTPEISSTKIKSIFKK